jgi:hypothetical protein
MTRWSKGDVFMWSVSLLGFVLILAMNAYWMFVRRQPPSPDMLQVSVIALMCVGIVLIIWAAAVTEPAPNGYDRRFEWGDVLMWIAVAIGLGLNVVPIIIGQIELIPQELKTPGIFLVLAAGVWVARKNSRQAGSREK